MNNTTTSNNLNSEFSLFETLMFIMINIVIVLGGIILWNFLWIKPKLSEIVEYIGGTINFYSSRAFSKMFSEIYKKIIKFDSDELIKTVGYESYSFLLFQRRVTTLIFCYLIVSLILSITSMIIDRVNGASLNVESIIFYFISNQNFYKVSNSIHVITTILFTFLHFRSFSMVKEESKFIYFNRFDKMSQKQNENWLSCRTLHISGINPEERNTSILQTKLKYFLCQNNGGNLYDINFIPNYRDLLYYEQKRIEIECLKDIISKRKTCRKFCMSSVYWTEDGVENELKRIEEKLDEIMEKPVLSSGHAFICLDSLSSACILLEAFHKNWWRTLKIKFYSLFDCCRPKKANINPNAETFGQLSEELDCQNLVINIESLRDITSNTDILLDQIIEPCDIIWLNIGIKPGRQGWLNIFLNLLIWAILLFLTTPTYFFSQLKMIDHYKLLDFKWFIDIPFGYLLMTYCVPLIILAINLGLICLIDNVTIFESHPTFYLYQKKVFDRSFFYLSLNCLIIPAIGLNSESLYSIIKTNYKNIFEMLSQIFLTKSTYFFITLLIQNGTISSIFYLLRLDELMLNAFSTEITFYLRHFKNIGMDLKNKNNFSNKKDNRHTYQRKERDIFLFGYFYSQYLVFYSICLIFSLSAPIICLAGLYLFIVRHFSDFCSFLMVHIKEIDSNGQLINHVLNMTCVPILIYQIFVIVVFINKKEYNISLIISVIFLLSCIYAWNFNSEYLLDIYSLKTQLCHYEDNKVNINNNYINKWRNKFAHPMVIPIFTKNEENVKKVNLCNQSKNLVSISSNQ